MATTEVQTKRREGGEKDAAGYRLFTTVDEGLEEMLRAIEEAKFSIRFEMYIYRASEIGEKFRAALMRACGRGVKVQVLLDALGSISLPESFWDSFVQGGGQFRWFNPLKFKRLGFRNHRKSLIIDEKLAFVGGFNIAPEYEGDGVTKGWHDLGMQVPEKMAAELTASFDAVFALSGYRHRLLARFRRSQVAKVAANPDGQLITTAPGRGPHFLNGALIRDAYQASSIDIISAYFLPPRQLRRALLKAARSGRRVRILVGAKSDVKLSQMAARYLYRGLLMRRVEIYEYQPQILHTKLFLFGDVVYVGSANMDKRSLLVNYELMVRVENQELAEQGRQFFEQALTQSTKIEWETWKQTRTIFTRLQENWAYFMLSKVDPYLTRLQLEVLHREISEREEAPKLVEVPKPEELNSR